MDADLKLAESHIILPAERLGDTLLISPHGDLGSYSAQTFHTEFQFAQKLVAQPRIKNLIIDLGGSRYFGSEMLGALLALRAPIVEQGGRAVLVHVSKDTMVGLSVIKADTLFEIMSTRSEALRKVARQTISDRVHHNRRALRWTAALLILLLGTWWLYASKVGFQVVGSRTARAYEEIAHLWREYEIGQGTWTSVESHAYGDKIIDELESIDKSIKRRHLYAVRDDHWLILAISDLMAIVRGTTSRESDFLRHMRLARYDILNRTGLDVSKLSPDQPEEMERLAMEGAKADTSEITPANVASSATDNGSPNRQRESLQTITTGPDDEGSTSNDREDSLETTPARD